jgi:hypothetical protein
MPNDITAAVGAGAFWAFISICVIAGVASGIFRHRETQKTIRQAIERGQTLDPETMDRLIRSNRPPPANPAGFLVGGIVLIFLGAGLAIMGWFISLQSHEAFYPMLGVGSLLGLLGLSLLVAGAVVGKKKGEGPE